MADNDAPKEETKVDTIESVQEERKPVEQPSIAEQSIKPFKVVPVKADTERKRQRRFLELEKRRVSYKKRKQLEDTAGKELTETPAENGWMSGVMAVGAGICGFLLLRNRI